MPTECAENDPRNKEIVIIPFSIISVRKNTTFCQVLTYILITTIIWLDINFPFLLHCIILLQPPSVSSIKTDDGNLRPSASSFASPETIGKSSFVIELRWSTGMFLSIRTYKLWLYGGYHVNFGKNIDSVTAKKLSFFIFKTSVF